MSVGGCATSRPGPGENAGISPAGLPPQVAAVGTPAPPLRARQLSDVSQEIALDQFAGKFVIVDFWATWCPPCRAEVPLLRDVYKKYSADPRVAMLSISLDTGPSLPRAFAATNQMSWNQGFGGSESQRTQLLDQWGVDYIPAVFLIAPDGKILARYIRGDDLSAVVEKAMNSKK